MSSNSSNSSNSSYNSQRPIIHSSGSSSRESTYYDSHSGHHSSANSSMSYEPSRVQYYRVPDNENKYITSKISKDGRVEIIHHEQSVYEEDAPRASEYRTTREPRDSRSSKSSKSSHRSSGK
ncbi:hypothetical protein HYALB_00006827 [Hymenoscyphus albidus]|uniref:Uncharacterized protein n=1 Tax=Hymenoscyphus albidus TaxID=595503 RepID=A0A9N9LI49_9HELO|nr:hypothetical protein HYALB_00006827 [Hymenoscyphus albidus]